LLSAMTGQFISAISIILIDIYGSKQNF
jgi:hypothetical protein